MSNQYKARHNAAFINNIAEEGTKGEALTWLQNIWDELQELKSSNEVKDTLTFEQFEKWYHAAHPKLYASELGQNGQFDELPFAVWEEMKNNNYKAAECNELIPQSITPTTTSSSISRLPISTKAALFDRIIALSLQHGDLRVIQREGELIVQRETIWQDFTQLLNQRIS